MKTIRWLRETESPEGGSVIEVTEEEEDTLEALDYEEQNQKIIKLDSWRRACALVLMMRARSCSVN